MKNNSYKIKTEDGIMAIIVAMVIMIVFALIILGFSLVANREKRAALDKQLSTQAFYAAESGVNDAVSALKNGYSIDKNQCGLDAVGPLSTVGMNVIDSTNQVRYTCLLINQSPGDLKYDDVSTNQVSTADATTTTPVQYLFISWQNIDDTPNFTDNGVAMFPKFYDTQTWNSNLNGDGTGVLQITVTDLNSGNYNRSTLLDRTFTAYLYPKFQSTNCVGGSPINCKGPVDFVPAGPNGANRAVEGQIVNGACHDKGVVGASRLAPYYCTAQIQIGPAGVTTSHLLITLNSLYADSKVSIIATGPSPAFTSLPISGAQVMVDSTGQAQDVSRRIQVRVPKSTSRPWAPVFSGSGVCKLLQVIPGGISTIAPGNGSYNNPAPPPAGYPECQPS